VNVLKANAEIIATEANQRGFIYTGGNLFTYEEWLKRGHVVMRGQRAFIRVYLWTSGINKRKVIKGLFTVDQVQKVQMNELIMI
jgi:hypothetical protein